MPVNVTVVFAGQGTQLAIPNKLFESPTKVKKFIASTLPFFQPFEMNTDNMDPVLSNAMIDG
jgi:hypothetical protein